MFYEKAETELSLFTQVSLKGDKGLTEQQIRYRELSFGVLKLLYACYTRYMFLLTLNC